MQNNLPSMLHLSGVEFLENETDSPTLVLYLDAVNESPSVLCDLANSFALVSLLNAVGVKDWETEQHADFTLTRFEYNQVICLLTIDEISESLWIEACTQSERTLSALKEAFEKYAL